MVNDLDDIETNIRYDAFFSWPRFRAVLGAFSSES